MSRWTDGLIAERIMRLRHGTILNYTTDINAAMLVVKAVHAHSPACLAYAMSFSQSAGQWCVMITQTDRSFKETVVAEVDNECLPMAICQAALTAMEVNYD